MVFANLLPGINSMNTNLRIIIDGQMSFNLASAVSFTSPDKDNHCLMFTIPRDALSETIPEKAKVFFNTPGKGERAGIIETIKAEAGHILLWCQFQA